VLIVIFVFIIGVGVMSGMFMLCKNEAEQILQTAIEEKVFAIMSYSSIDEWRVTKVQLTELAAGKLKVEVFEPRPKPRPMDIQVNQPVGMSFKHAYGKFIFDTNVVALEYSGNPVRGVGRTTIVLAAPDQIEMIQRRSYFRVNVPHFLNVSVTLWRHRQNGNTGPMLHELNRPQMTSCERRNYYLGKLVDISAGGAQIMIPKQNGADLDFRKGKYIGLRFTPMPYEMPLMFNAQIRNILPAEDHKSIYLCLQIVGLEVSSEGRRVLSRIAEVTERYYRLNLSDAKQLCIQGDIDFYSHISDMQQVPSQC
jgi:hypothetical protein